MVEAVPETGSLVARNSFAVISAEDFVHIPFTTDLSDAGIVHLCRNMPRLGGGARITGHSMRRSIAATSAQLAFRRYLALQDLAFGASAPSDFAQHEAPNVRIGRRTWALKSFLISRQSQIEALAGNPALALQAPALVPSDRFAAEELREDDAYVFALVTAALAGPRAQVLGSRQYWIYTLASAWRRPRIWAPLGPLIVKSEAKADIWLELGGEVGSGDFHQTKVRLASRERKVVDAPFHSLSYVRVPERPAGRVGIRSAARRESQLIIPTDWQNVWLEGREILLLGWITREEFLMRARPIREGARVFQFGATKVKNLAVDVSTLKPIQRLVELSRH
jgi:hypothetical protein